ncbi:MAG: biopolymer transporter ExbD [Phycisphaerae bacterium]|nr:biopolymer transporter ExbD [Phycisphaerae bacterium]
MRRRLLHQPGHAFEGVNVTPMIDVVMCLIVFFLIVGKLASDASSIRLPESASGRASSTRGGIVIGVARGDTPGVAPAQRWGGVLARVFVDGSSVSGESELVQAIRDRAAALGARVEPAPGQPQIPLSVRADRDLPWAALEPVMRAAAAAGFPGVRLATERQGPAGGGGGGGEGRP